MLLPQVFISYRHDDEHHRRNVRRLGESLRHLKIPVVLDQFLLDEHAGGPDIGWPKWCEDCANQSARVLIVASEGWFAAYDKTAPSATGLGAATEADIFRQTLWDEQGNNSRVRLAFLHDVSAEKVPVRLRAWHQFRPFDGGAQLNALVRWVADGLGLANIELPTVRWPEPPEFHPDLANRTKKEWPAIVELLAGRSKQRIVLYEGASGLGKSALVDQAVIYAKKLNIPVVRVNCRGGGLDVPAILGQFDLDLSTHLPNFSREGADKTHLLRKDLRALREPVLVIFDGYEDSAGNKTIADWLNQQFLTEVETARGLAVIIAGQQVPSYSRTGWRDLVLHIPLSPIRDTEHWEPWIERHYPQFRKKGADLRTVLLATEGNPMAVSQACEIISKS